MATKRRLPKLRVVSHSLEGIPRRRVSWGNGTDHCDILEIWIEKDWALLHPCERPDLERVWHVPGIGYLLLKMGDAAEGDEVAREARLAEQNWRERGEMRF